MSYVTNYRLTYICKDILLFSSRSLIVLALTLRLVLWMVCSRSGGLFFPCLLCLFFSLFIIHSASAHFSHFYSQSGSQCWAGICASLTLSASLSWPLLSPELLSLFPSEPLQLLPLCLYSFPFWLSLYLCYFSVLPSFLIFFFSLSPLPQKLDSLSW